MIARFKQLSEQARQHQAQQKVATTQVAVTKPIVKSQSSTLPQAAPTHSTTKEPITPSVPHKSASTLKLVTLDICVLLSLYISVSQ